MATVARNTEPKPKCWRRDTRGGRTLEYQLKVIQQPERARACGSGAKSSADRRPVDPPPVVELRIFDLGKGPDGEDITFSYEANFFLFATLEVARIAHARGQPQPPSQQVPVLTGMPVSGMAYLDRPTEAGYFIFPDLSVRHEGRYRLSFNLYEETKKLDDTDKETSMDKKTVGGGSPDASFDWRMEVKSDMFTVYSAKKFPGLAESTTLSRTVAEQGCRVRIRRDVRMRRRDGKGAGDYDEAPEDDGYRGRAADQEPYRERSRSNSAAGNEGQGPYQQDPTNPHFQAQRSLTASPINPNPTAPGSNLAWIPGPSQFAAPPQHFQPPPPGPPSYPVNPQSASYPAPGPPAPPSYRTEPPPPTHHYQYTQERQYPQSANPAYPPREQRAPIEPERRASYTGYGPPAPQPRAPYPTVDTNYSRHPHYPPPANDHHMGGPTQLPPLKITPSESKYESFSPSGPLTSIRSIAPPFPSPVHERGQDPGSFYGQYNAVVQAAPEPSRNGNKRPYDYVFDSSSNVQPLHNGMRPSSSHGEDDDDDFEANACKMEYRRADGNPATRELPSMME